MHLSMIVEESDYQIVENQGIIFTDQMLMFFEVFNERLKRLSVNGGQYQKGWEMIYPQDRPICCK